MPYLKLHLTRLDRLAENPVTDTARTVLMAEVPSIGQYLVVDSEACVVTATYLRVDEDPSAHVFATWTSVSEDHAKRIGLVQSSAGYPSLAGFDGQTIGDLTAFLSEYPRDMGVRFTNDEVLVAKAKGETVILRLDDKDEA